jgi:hypothetical protein
VITELNRKTIRSMCLAGFSVKEIASVIETMSEWAVADEVARCCQTKPIVEQGGCLSLCPTLSFAP